MCSGPKQAAPAAPAPEEEPPTVRSRFQGLRVMPCSGQSPGDFQPNSVVVVLPRMTAPACFRPITAGASSSAGVAAVVLLPRRVGKPARFSRSFTVAGTPSGLDMAGQSSSPYDLALIFRALLADPTTAAVLTTPVADLPGVEGRSPGYQIQNQNPLAGTPGNLGGKTGFTDAARHTFVTAADRGGRRLVVSIMDTDRVPMRAADQAAMLLDWGSAVPAGVDMTSYSIGSDGKISAIFSDGIRRDLAQIAVADFVNPQGLDKTGESTYRASANSGAADLGVAGEEGRGNVKSGSLEMSNVDLAAEFTNLILAQRGFQASSRVITTSDQVLEELVNIKR